jgi:glycosyltransferase involved in cell wall biosynthesis
MNNSRRILVVIPAYNEEGNLPQVISRLKSVNIPFDVVIIDDGSKDGTFQIASDAGMNVLRHPYNLGYGAALQTGFRFGMRGGYTDIITMDGDDQHDPDSIPELLKVQRKSGADVVIGSRFLSGNYRMGIARKIGSWIFAKAARLYTGMKFTDPTSGFQLLNRKAFAYLATEEDYPLDYPDVNIIMLLHKRRFQIAEAPARMTEKKNGSTMHGGIKPFFYVLRMFLAITMVLLRKED